MGKARRARRCRLRGAEHHRRHRTGRAAAKDDTNDEVLAWFTDHKGGIKLSAAVAGLSIMALVWWFGSLWRRMSKAENGNHRLSIVALASFVGSGLLFAASTAVYVTPTIRLDTVSPELARLLFQLGTVLLSFAGFFLTVHLVATNALSLRSGFLPKWATWVGLVSALSFLVSAFGVTTDADIIMFFGLIGFVLWAVWILGVSVHMWRTAEA